MRRSSRTATSRTTRRLIVSADRVDLPLQAAAMSTRRCPAQPVSAGAGRRSRHATGASMRWSQMAARQEGPAQLRR